MQFPTPWAKTIQGPWTKCHGGLTFRFFFAQWIYKVAPLNSSFVHTLLAFAWKISRVLDVLRRNFEIQAENLFPSNITRIVYTKFIEFVYTKNKTIEKNCISCLIHMVRSSLSCRLHLIKGNVNNIVCGFIRVFANESNPKFRRINNDWRPAFFPPVIVSYIFEKLSPSRLINICRYDLNFATVHFVCLLIYFSPCMFVLCSKIGCIAIEFIGSN